MRIDQDHRILTFKKELDPKVLKIGILTATFNHSITKKLKDAAIKTLTKTGLYPDHILCFDVPGAFELPLAAQKLIHTHQVDAVICLGCVIRGGTPHFEYVSQACVDGIAKVSLEESVPVIFGVLTTDTPEQATERSTGKENKGIEAANAALDMINLFHTLESK